MTGNSGMPAVNCFIDTNVLLYAISSDPADVAKQTIAQQILTTESWGWSAQVAAEFINSSTSRRRRNPLSLAAAGAWIDSWKRFPMVPVETQTVKEALRIAQQSQITYYDAQIIAAAKLIGCGMVYTEDLNHGQFYGGVRVVNPFAGLVP